MTFSEVRTRFAPSPTGFQHIGGFRTAFFAWLVAKHYGGKFLIRIEDTDQTRKVEGAVHYILRELKWFGIEPDEGPSAEELHSIGESSDGIPTPGGAYGPYVQSLRLNRYKEIAENLVASGAAYRCDLSQEQLDEERVKSGGTMRPEILRGREVDPEVPHVIRFKMPARPKVVLDDAVKGKIVWNSIPLVDPVLLKTDGFPTYHLACVVDDHDMKISHVMRGDEWVPSAPLHVLLYEALSWELPIFAHLPVILGPDGKKLSKRHGATLASALRDDGYLAEAVLNFVCLIGWSPGEGEEQEIFSKDELIKRFSLEHINKASGVFQYTKLDWMNGAYIRSLSPEVFVNYLKPYLEAANIPADSPGLLKIAPHIQERVRVLPDAIPMIEFLFRDEIKPEWEELSKTKLSPDEIRKVLELSYSKLNSLEDLSATKVDEAIKEVVSELGLKAGPVFITVRIAVTGKKITPPLSESIEVLGKLKTLERLQNGIRAVANL